MPRGGRRSTSFTSETAHTKTTWAPGTDIPKGRGFGNSGNPNPTPRLENLGRPKGVRNKTAIGATTVEKMELRPDERPLAFFLRMMKGDPFQVREMGPEGKLIEKTIHPTFADMKWGAAMAAPYMHPKLANIEHSGNVTTRHEDFIDKLAQEDNGTVIEHEPTQH